MTHKAKGEWGFVDGTRTWEGVLKGRKGTVGKKITSSAWNGERRDGGWRSGYFQCLMHDLVLAPGAYRTRITSPDECDPHLKEVTHKEKL
jgi:hypothetical protein